MCFFFSVRVIKIEPQTTYFTCVHSYTYVLHSPQVMLTLFIIRNNNYVVNFTYDYARVFMWIFFSFVLGKCGNVYNTYVLVYLLRTYLLSMVASCNFCWYGVWVSVIDNFSQRAWRIRSEAALRHGPFLRLVRQVLFRNWQIIFELRDCCMYEYLRMRNTNRYDRVRM